MSVLQRSCFNARSIMAAPLAHRSCHTLRASRTFAAVVGPARFSPVRMRVRRLGSIPASRANSRAEPGASWTARRTASGKVSMVIMVMTTRFAVNWLAASTDADRVRKSESFRPVVAWRKGTAARAHRHSGAIRGARQLLHERQSIDRFARKPLPPRPCVVDSMISMPRAVRPEGSTVRRRPVAIVQRREAHPA